MNNKKSGAKTLFMSVLMSAPGPLVIGISLLSGKSTTQIADFVRRSSELLAIILSYIVFKKTMNENDDSKKKQLERKSNIFVGSMMCVGGFLMILLTLFSQSTDKGNVTGGLVIALLGVIANSIFWRKYTKLNKQEPNAILEVQSRLYRAKTLVDGCVTIALLSVLIAPHSQISIYLDFIGSIIVAIYLMYCGIKTINEYKTGGK